MPIGRLAADQPCRRLGAARLASAAGRAGCQLQRPAVGRQACLARHPAHTVFPFQGDHLDGYGRRCCTSVRAAGTRQRHRCAGQPPVQKLRRSAQRPAGSARRMQLPVAGQQLNGLSVREGGPLTSAVHQSLQHVQHDTHHTPMLAGRQEQHDFQQSLGLGASADLWHAVLLRPAGQHFQQ